MDFSVPEKSHSTVEHIFYKFQDWLKNHRNVKANWILCCWSQESKSHIKVHLESRKQEVYFPQAVSKIICLCHEGKKRQITQTALGQIFTYTVDSRSATDKLYMSKHTYT